MEIIDMCKACERVRKYHPELKDSFQCLQPSSQFQSIMTGITKNENKTARNTEEESNKKDFEEMSTGAKKDLKGKSPLELNPPEFEEILNKGLHAGMDKGYPANNWRKGIPFEKSLAAARRHMNKWRRGIDIDEETGVNHLYLCALNVMMVCYQIEKGTGGLDDRFKEEKE